MNKIAFISDIHGNFPALSAVLNDINQQGIDQIFCLGDLVGYYCCINEVIDEIRKNCIESCLGNHDFALINNGGIIQRSKTCTTTLTKQLGYISKDNINYLKKMSSKLTISYNDKKIICIHGGLNNHIDEYVNYNDINEKYLQALVDNCQYLFMAHTHIPWIKSVNGILCCNVGSVGQPRDNDCRASYCILSGKNVEIRRVTYNIDEIVKIMSEAGYSEYISNVLYKGVKIGG